MPMYLYENHGVLITETPAVVGEEFIPTDDNGARVYEFGMPSTIDERVDITVHTDTKYKTRTPSITQESEEFVFVVDFNEGYFSLPNRISTFTFEFPSDYTTNGQWTGVELKVTNVEPDDNFVAGDGDQKKMTITCELQDNFTVVPASD